MSSTIFIHSVRLKSIIDLGKWSFAFLFSKNTDKRISKTQAIQQIIHFNKRIVVKDSRQIMIYLFLLSHTKGEKLELGYFSFENQRKNEIFLTNMILTCTNPSFSHIESEMCASFSYSDDYKLEIDKYEEIEFETIQQYQKNIIVNSQSIVRIVEAPDSTFVCKELLSNDYMREILPIISLDLHPCIIKMVNYHVSRDRICIGLEYAENGSLRNLLNKRLLTLDQKIRCLYGLCSALSHLHSNGYIYRDLKPENILFDSEFNVKLADFGTTRSINKNDKELTQDKGTINYQAPEILKGENYSYSADYFSFGLVFAEMKLNGPYTGLNLNGEPEHRYCFDFIMYLFESGNILVPCMNIHLFQQYINSFSHNTSHLRNDLVQLEQKVMKEIDCDPEVFFTIGFLFYRSNKYDKASEYLKIGESLDSYRSKQFLETMMINRHCVAENHKYSTNAPSANGLIGLFSLAHDAFQKGMLCANGGGIREKKINDSLRYFECCEKIGSSYGYYGNAYLYFYGKAVEKDESKAIVLLQEAARRNNRKAYRNLGHYYASKLGKLYEAYNYYLRAVDLCYFPAFSELGELCELIKKYEEAKILYEAGDFNGDFKCSAFLGILYLNVYNDMENALVYLNKAHEKEVMVATTYLAKINIKEGNTDEGLKFLKMSLDEGEYEALIYAGELYSDPSFEKYSISQARIYYLFADSQGDASCQHKLGLLYNGDSRTKLLFYLYKAADKKYLPALIDLAFFDLQNAKKRYKNDSESILVLEKVESFGLRFQTYEEFNHMFYNLKQTCSNNQFRFRSKPPMFLDKKEKGNFYNELKSNAEKGEYVSAYYLANLLPKGKEYGHYIKIAADQGLSIAQYDYANYLSHEKDVNAIHYYQLCADSNVKACSRLAEIYFYGELGVTNKPLGIEWAIKAAATNDPELVTYLGTLYMNIGNFTSALNCFLNSANKNDKTALYNIAIFYRDGYGVSKDMNYSYHYMKVAADLGHKIAQYEVAKFLLEGA